MSNRRDFIRKGVMAGAGLSGLTAANLLGAQPMSSGKTYAPPEPPIYRQIQFSTAKDAGTLTTKAIQIFYRMLSERTGLDFAANDKAVLIIEMKILCGSMPPEAFEITPLRKQVICITAHDENGLLYGLGKLLHTSHWSEEGFRPGSWSGRSVPDKPIRLIYFATHFHNFYHEAAVEKVVNYVEELAFWGYNGLMVWFDMHHYEGIDDPKAKAMLERLQFLLRVGKSVGMKSCIGMLANEGYASSPSALRAKPVTQIRLRGGYGVEICPSQPGGTELILKQVEEELERFQGAGIAVDYISLWPYDQGGCGCSQCLPWGSNGYLKIAKKITGLVRKRMPGVKIILSTWLFDCEQDEGEWTGLANSFKEAAPFVDYILADSHQTYPAYLLSNPVPGKLPLLNFPEISMWESHPWGGFGANPLPGRFQLLWNSVKDKVAGGYPYSEGIFEDINKVIYSQFYWNREQSAIDTLKEYVSFEFGAIQLPAILEAIGILEKNHGLKGSAKKIRVPATDFGAARAYALLKSVDSRLPGRTKNGWRWRILLLRAMFDDQFRQSNGYTNATIEAGLKELSGLYYAENADNSVRPPAGQLERIPQQQK